MAKSFNLCQHCGKDFKNYKLYWEHLQRHKIRSMPCDSCKKLFASAKTGNKVHVIIDHVPQAIERTRKGLLGNSEQVVEATHAKFEKFWLKYVVVDLESDIHGERLLECVIDFNSSNI